MEQDENKIVKYAKEDMDFARNYLKLHTPLQATKMPGRNDICPFCNSGVKFKHCACYKLVQKEYKNKYYLE